MRADTETSNGSCAATACQSPKAHCLTELPHPSPTIDCTLHPILSPTPSHNVLLPHHILCRTAIAAVIKHTCWYMLRRQQGLLKQRREWTEQVTYPLTTPHVLVLTSPQLCGHCDGRNGRGFVTRCAQCRASYAMQEQHTSTHKKKVLQVQHLAFVLPDYKVLLYSHRHSNPMQHLLPSPTSQPNP
jgi:hypothetical protein